MSTELTDAERKTLGEWPSSHRLGAAVQEILASRLAAVTAATDDAARHLGYVHPVVLALRKALGAS